MNVITEFLILTIITGVAFNLSGFKVKELKILGGFMWFGILTSGVILYCQKNTTILNSDIFINIVDIVSAVLIHTISDVRVICACSVALCIGRFLYKRVIKKSRWATRIGDLMVRKRTQNQMIRGAV